MTNAMLDAEAPAVMTQIPKLQDTPEGHGLFEVIGMDGDTKTTWDRENPDEVKAARKQFKFLVEKKKYLAFSVVGRDGNRGLQMHEFDPNAERILFVPPMAGG